MNNETEHKEVLGQGTKNQRYLSVLITLIEQKSGWSKRAIAEYTDWLKSIIIKEN